MKLGKFLKAPAERIRYVIDYNDWLDLDEAVAGVSFAPEPAQELDDLIVDSSSVAVDGRSVVIFISGGIAGIDYVLTVVMTSLGGQIKQDYILFAVRN